MKNQKIFLKIGTLGLLLLGGLLAYGVTSKNQNIVAKINQEEAVRIAIKDMPNGQLKKAKLENKRRGPVYDIELWQGNTNTKKEYKIDANTGKILRTKTDTDSDELNPAIANTKISVEQAKSIAKKQDPNATLKSIELERKKGKLVYEVELIEGYTKKEYKIDAETGEILSFEID
jgi:peptidase propeptide and YPEB domain protein